jgi:hypothetical protein
MRRLLLWMFPKPHYMAGLFLFATALLILGGVAFAYHTQSRGQGWSVASVTKLVALVVTSESPYRLWFAAIAALLMASFGLSVAYITNVSRIRSRAIAMFLVTAVLWPLAAWINLSVLWLLLGATIFAALCVFFASPNSHGA